jgi:6-phosphofructokinase 1
MRVLIGQGGGPTPVINYSLSGVIDGLKEGKVEILGMRNGIEGGGLNREVEGNVIDLSDFNSSKIKGIPGAFLGTCRVKLSSKKKNDIVKIRKLEENINHLGAEGIMYIGGNDSADTLSAIKSCRTIHIAKTIDNDLPKNDHTPGWGSSCLFNSRAIRRLEQDMKGFSPRIMHENREVYSTAPVVVYQTQGRDTGWLAIGSAFAKLNKNAEVRKNYAPHLFLTRERAYNEKELLDAVDDFLSEQGYVFVVCGEELVDTKGVPLSKIYSSGGEILDEHEHVEHARSNAFNYANFVAARIKSQLKVESKPYLKIKETPLSAQHLQRVYECSKVDAEEAYEVGKEAARAFLDGGTAISVGLKRIGNYKMVAERIPLREVSGKVRRVEEFYLGDIHGPSPQFYSDYLPLIGGIDALEDYPRIG